MSLFNKFYSLAKNIALGLALTTLLSHCSPSRKLVDEPAARTEEPQPTTTTPRKEGGIVGTGNTQGCKDKKDKSQCSESVQ